MAIESIEPWYFICPAACVSTTSRQHTLVALDVRMKLCSTAQAAAHAQISSRGGSVWPSPKLVLPFRVPTRLARISLHPRDQYRQYTMWCYASSPDIAYSHRYCGFTIDWEHSTYFPSICREPIAESRFLFLFLFLIAKNIESFFRYRTLFNFLYVHTSVNFLHPV